MKSNMKENVFTKINNLFGNGIKTIIGILLIAVSVVIDIAVGFSYNYNALVTILASIGFISLINAVYSKIYKIPLSYILFIVANVAGMFLYLFVISKYEVIGQLFTILFSILVFLALWIFEMCILNGAGLKRRILGGLLVNVTVIVVLAITALIVVGIPEGAKF